MNISIICLAIGMFGLIILIHQVEKDIRLNYIMIQTIFSFLHKKYGVTVEEMKEIWENYAKNDIDYVEK